jgi:hypothetical protein
MEMWGRTNEIVNGIQCARIPNKMLVARNKNPKSKYTFQPLNKSAFLHHHNPLSGGDVRENTVVHTEATSKILILGL